MGYVNGVRPARPTHSPTHSHFFDGAWAMERSSDGDIVSTHSSDSSSKPPRHDSHHEPRTVPAPTSPGTTESWVHHERCFGGLGRGVFARLSFWLCWCMSLGYHPVFEKRVRMDGTRLRVDRSGGRGAFGGRQAAQTVRCVVGTVR